MAENSDCMVGIIDQREECVWGIFRDSKLAAATNNESPKKNSCCCVLKIEVAVKEKINK